jgi:hypothetical protein
MTHLLQSRAERLKTRPARAVERSREAVACNIAQGQGRGPPDKQFEAAGDEAVMRLREYRKRASCRVLEESVVDSSGVV